MSEFKLPHVEDLTTNSKLPGQLTEDMKAMEQAVNDLRGEIDKMTKQDQEDTTFLDNLYK